jgi:hypothetical protein
MVRRLGEGLGARIRALIERYLAEGELLEADAVEVETLRDSPEVARLPRRPGNRLQNALFLVGQSLASLDHLAARRSHEAASVLLEALAAAEGETDATSFADGPDAAELNDPFEGLLYVLAARLAHEAGSEHVGDRMRQRAVLMRDRLRDEDEAMANLLDAFLDEG